MAKKKKKLRDRLINEKLVNLREFADEFFARNYPDAFEDHHPLLIDLDYAKEQVPPGPGYVEQNPGLPDNPFGKIYHDDAVAWAHRALAIVVVEAAAILRVEQKWDLQVKDCMRPVDGQKAMKGVAEANNWPNDYVSKPGYGAHPRGMAIDIVPVYHETGKPVDMGSAFDHFGPRSNRGTEEIDDAQKKNREILDEAMERAAKIRGKKVRGHPTEWWDYRLSDKKWLKFPALKEEHLPPAMRMTMVKAEQAGKKTKDTSRE